MGKISEGFGGTVDESRGSFQIDLATPTISSAKMEEVMKSLGFKEFSNVNVGEHRSTYWFGYGAYHWEGNVLGNWYHLNFVPVGKLPFSSTVRLAKELHYEPDRPEDWDHRKPNRDNRREPCP